MSCFIVHYLPLTWGVVHMSGEIPSICWNENTSCLLYVHAKYTTPENSVWFTPRLKHYYVHAKYTTPEICVWFTSSLEHSLTADCMYFMLYYMVKNLIPSTYIRFLLSLCQHPVVGDSGLAQWRWSGCGFCNGVISLRLVVHWLAVEGNSEIRSYRGITAWGWICRLPWSHSCELPHVHVCVPVVYIVVCLFIYILECRITDSFFCEAKLSCLHSFFAFVK